MSGASKPITPRRLRILNAFTEGDLIWEVAGKNYYTQFNARTGKQRKIPRTEVEEMVALGWIRRIIPPASAHRLESCELTEQGRNVLQQRFPPKTALGSVSSEFSKHSRKTA